MPAIIEGKRKWSTGLAAIAGIIKLSLMVSAGTLVLPMGIAGVVGIVAVSLGLIKVQGDVDKAKAGGIFHKAVIQASDMGVTIDEAKAAIETITRGSGK